MSKLVENSYAALGRLNGKTYKHGTSGQNVSIHYGFEDWADSNNSQRASSRIKGIDYTYVRESGDLSIYDRYYTYNGNGSILTESIWMSGQYNILREKYSYDAFNQLIRHDSVTQGKSFQYTYDNAGNITSKSEYAYTTRELESLTPTNTVSYTYGDSSWGDLLTAYNGNSITYDSIGNPLSYNGNSYTWFGGQLQSVANSSNTYNYTYNADGIRTAKKTLDENDEIIDSTEFLLNGTQILAQKTGNDVLFFYYDITGQRVGFSRGSSSYYYIYNQQGDVIAIASATIGGFVATREYSTRVNDQCYRPPSLNTNNLRSFRTKVKNDNSIK